MLTRTARECRILGSSADAHERIRADMARSAALVCRRSVRAFGALRSAAHWQFCGDKLPPGSVLLGVGAGSGVRPRPACPRPRRGRCGHARQ
jgi:hypothetical protein